MKKKTLCYLLAVVCAGSAAWYFGIFRPDQKIDQQADLWLAEYHVGDVRPGVVGQAYEIPLRKRLETPDKYKTEIAEYVVSYSESKNGTGRLNFREPWTSRREYSQISWYPAAKRLQLMSRSTLIGALDAPPVRRRITYAVAGTKLHKLSAYPEDAVDVILADGVTDLPTSAVYIIRYILPARVAKRVVEKLHQEVVVAKRDEKREPAATSTHETPWKPTLPEKPVSR